MSDVKKGTLSEEQVKKAIAWVEKHWNKQDKSCDICSGKSWTIGSDLVTPVIFSGGFSMGNAYPQIMMMCNTCGNTKYFNAMIAKIIEPSGQDKKDEK